MWLIAQVDETQMMPRSDLSRGKSYDQDRRRGDAATTVDVACADDAIAVGPRPMMAGDD